MTPTRLRYALAVLRWSASVLADELHCGERTVRRWLAGDPEVPPSIAAWLEQLVAAHLAHPPPDGPAWRERRERVTG